MRMDLATLLAATLMRITGAEHLKKGAIAGHTRGHCTIAPLCAISSASTKGTTSSRALLFDERAALLGVAQEEHPQNLS
jgi:hypothetical protein